MTDTEQVVTLEITPEPKKEDPINGWDEDNINTVRTWKSSLAKSSFIYQHIKDKLSDRLSNILLYIFIFNSINTVIGGITTTAQTTDNETLRQVSLILSAVLWAANAVVTLLSAYIKHLKLDSQVSDLSSYIQKQDSFYLMVANELIKPKDLRKHGNEFIIENSEKFLNIGYASPEVRHTDFMDGSIAYNKFLHDDQLDYQFYDRVKNDDGKIEIV